jgi:hypothetical protein
MTSLVLGRQTVDYDRDVVVFLIGMRVNRWWRPDLWWPVAMAMPRMMKELSGTTNLGFLGGEAFVGNPTLSLQYWESAEALIDYARSQDHAHLPAWVDFRRRVAKTDAVGVWHETYRVARGAQECIYVNMPAFGMGRVGKLVPAAGSRKYATDRLSVTASASAPEE